METPCSRPIQTITENEFLGNSLRKLNDNFQVLQLNICQLEHQINGLSKQLTELGIPEEPRCGKKGDLDLCPEIEKVVNIPDPETCVQETRLPLVNSFVNLKELACNLYTTIQSLSTTVNKNVAGASTTQSAPFEPIGCTYTDGISPDEYLGDSYDKIRNNLINLRDKYCTISKLVNNLEKRITCPKPTPKRQKLVDRFTMQGEGGYAWNTYNFVNRDKVYAPESYANTIRDIMSQAEYDKHRYTVTFNGTQFYGLSGGLRVSQAANNNTVMLRNGTVYYVGGTPNGPYKSNWVAQNASIMYDMFMPSTHGSGGPTQVVLLTTGNLHFLDLRQVKANPSHIPPVILPNIDRFACINQSHNSDLIVISKDKKVYHVGVLSTSGSPNPYGYQEITNMGDTDDIAFMQIGDAADSCYVCYNSDLTKVYPINCSVADRTGHDKWGWFTSKNNTAKSITLDLEEYFVDGCSNEFDNVFLTNKRVLCYHNIDTCCGGTCGVTYTEHALPFGSKAVRMATSCSYSMAVELSDGYYLLSRRPISEYNTGGSNAACNGYPTYQYFAKFDYWNTLITNLSATRPDIFGFGENASKCSCDPAPPPEPPPSCEPVRPDLLDRFAMQGEGGYHAFTYNFVDKDKIYGNAEYKKVFDAVLGNYVTTYYYTTSIGGTTWHALKNAIRICSGNTNVAGIFRNGKAYVSGAEYDHPWISNTYLNWKDLFMPSSYETTVRQGVLFKTGELYAIKLNETDVTKRQNGPPPIKGLTTLNTEVTLNNIDRFLTINQSHNGDILVAGKDDKVWHVAFARAPEIPADTGGYAKQIKNLEASKILCIALGDPSFSSHCVLKADPTKLYKITCANSGRDLSHWGWFTERNLTPVLDGVNKTLTIGGNTYPNFLETGERFVDMCANEFHLTLLTNKYAHVFQGQSSGVGDYVKHAIPAGLSAVRMCTSTSYTMAVELSDGYYLLAAVTPSQFENATNDGGSGTYTVAYSNFGKVRTWTTLAQNLSTGRPDIVPFGSSCDQPTNWNCLKTFQEEAEILAFPKSEDVVLQSNVFYPVSAYQEGIAYLDGAGTGFTGTASVSFRHPNYPTTPDITISQNSDPTSSTGDAIIMWNPGLKKVYTYYNYPTGIIKTEDMPWSERRDILVSHKFTGGINTSIVAKKYKEPDTSICFFPVLRNTESEYEQPLPCYLPLTLNTTITASYDTALNKYEVTTPDGVTHKIIPYEDKKTAEEHYLYNPNDASSHTGYEVSEQSRIYFYRKLGTVTPVNLVFNHDRPNDGSGGSIKFTFSPKLPTGSTWIAKDDGSSDSFSDTACDWSWSPCCTDGGAVQLPNGSHTFTITSLFRDGINDWVWWESCGTGATCSKFNQSLLINSEHKRRLINVTNCMPSSITVNGRLYCNEPITSLIVLNPGGVLQGPDGTYKGTIINNGGTISTAAPADLNTYTSIACCF
jgi:hypothetical protein